MTCMLQVCVCVYKCTQWHTHARARIWMYIFVIRYIWIRYIHIYETWAIQFVKKNIIQYISECVHIFCKFASHAIMRTDKIRQQAFLPAINNPLPIYLEGPPQEKTGGDTARAAETAGGKDAASREVHDSLRAPRCPCRVARRETRRSKGRRGRYTCRRGRRQGTFRCRQMMMTQNSCYSCLAFQILTMIFIRVFFIFQK